MADRSVLDIFPGVDLEAFWNDSVYALGAYVDVSPSDALVAAVRAELGYRLPASYLALMRSHNGGVPHRTRCPSPRRTTWADDHVAVDGIMGIGRDKPDALLGAAAATSG